MTSTIKENGHKEAAEKALLIRLHTNILSESLRNRLVDILRQSRGASPVNLLLSDPKTGMEIMFFSKKYKVDITSELMESLKAIGIEVSLGDCNEPKEQTPFVPAWDITNSDF